MADSETQSSQSPAGGDQPHAPDGLPKNTDEATSNLLLQVIRAAAESDSVATARQQILALLCRGLSWPYGEIWLPDTEQVALHSSEAWYDDSPHLDVFHEHNIRLTYPRGTGLPGYVWLEGRSLWIGDLATATGSAAQGAEAAIEAGFQGVLGVPLIIDGDVAAVLLFFTSAPAGREAAVELTTQAITQLTGTLRRVAQREELQARETLLATLVERLEQRSAAQADELRHVYEQLAQATRLKDEFLAVMSHELRTPLNSVITFAEACRAGVYGPLNERQEQALGTIVSSGQQLLNLINDILEFVRLEAGEIALTFEPVMLDELCAVSLRMVQPAALARDIQVSANEFAPGNAIVADFRRLTQVLVRLLSNAIAFTPTGGKVGLEVAPDPDNNLMRLIVWDTGIGISDTDRAKIFVPFVQLDSGLARRHEGVGLGLALVDRLVRLHGGTISVTSNPGRGSRFVVALPWRPGG